MKRKILIGGLLFSLSSLAYAGNMVAVIKNTEKITFIKTEDLLPEDPNAISTVKCTWGECIGAYNSGQAFYINGKSGTATTENISLTNATEAYASGNYLFIKDSGKLYARGINERGTLGIGSSDTGEVTVETETVGLSGEIKKVIPEIPSLVLTSTGMYFAGRNYIDTSIPVNSSLTYGDNYNEFKNIVLSSAITDISMEGNAVAYALNGELYFLGLNKDGSFGMGSSAVDTSYSTYTKVPSLTGVTEVFIGKNDGNRGRVYILKDGNIWSAGDMDYYLGLGSTYSAITEFQDTGFSASELKMFSDDNYTLLIKDNQLYYTGSNPFGESTRTGKFVLLEDTKDIKVKDFITKEFPLQILTVDGKVLKENRDAIPEPDSDPILYEVVDNISFGG